MVIYSKAHLVELSFTFDCPLADLRPINWYDPATDLL